MLSFASCNTMEPTATPAKFDLLLRLNESAQGAGDLADVYEHAIDAATVGLRTDRASLLLFDERGCMRFRASRGLSDEYRKAVDGHSPWSPNAVDPTPVIVADVLADSAWEAYHVLFRAEQIGALAFFPLLRRGRLLGKLTVYFPEPRPLRDDEIVWATLVSHTTAQAVSLHRAEVQSVRALEETRQARQSAESIRLDRNEVLGLVVHDLRNPLNTLKLSLSLLSRSTGNRDEDKLTRQLERMERALAGLEQSIDSLSDVVGIQSGRIQMGMVSEDLTSILDRSLQVLVPAAAERSQTLTVDVPLGIRVLGDRERIAQAVTHLVRGSIRSTSSKGWIRLCGRKVTTERGSMVEIAVADSGPGLAAEELSRALEQPWSVSRGTGTGLGLIAAKGIIEAHRGTLSVESPPGSGAIFRVMLPASD